EATTSAGSRRPQSARAAAARLGSARARGTISADETPQRAQRAVGDLLHRPGGVDAQQDALVGVEGDERRGLLLVHIQPVPDGLLAVIVSLEELAAAVVTGLRPGGRIEQHVPDVPAPAAGPASGQPPDYLVVVDDQLEHDVEPDLPLDEDLLQGLGLRDVARE